MSGGTVDGFPVGAELLLELDGEGGPRWYRFMHQFGGGGGWVREVDEDGSLDNDRDGIRIVAGSRVVLSSRKVPPRVKPGRKNSGTKHSGDLLHF